MVQLLSNILGKRKTQKTGNVSAICNTAKIIFQEENCIFISMDYDIFLNDNIINISKDSRELIFITNTFFDVILISGTYF